MTLWAVAGVALAPLAQTAEVAQREDAEAALAEVEVVALSLERQRAVVRAPLGDDTDGEDPKLTLLAVGDTVPGVEAARVAAILTDRLEVTFDAVAASAQPPGEAARPPGRPDRAWLYLDGGVSVFSSQPPAAPPVYRPGPEAPDPGQAGPSPTPRPVDPAEVTPEATTGPVRPDDEGGSP